jgi:hypothetical protein
MHDHRTATLTAEAEKNSLLRLWRLGRRDLSTIDLICLVVYARGHSEHDVEVEINHELARRRLS